MGFDFSVRKRNYESMVSFWIFLFVATSLSSICHAKLFVKHLSRHTSLAKAACLLCLLTCLRLACVAVAAAAAAAGSGEVLRGSAMAERKH